MGGDYLSCQNFAGEILITFVSTNAVLNFLFMYQQNMFLDMLITIKYVRDNGLMSIKQQAII